MFSRFQSASRTGATKGCFAFGFTCSTVTSRSGCGNGSGRSTTAQIAENTALFAPMPSASVAITVAVNPVARRSPRAAWRKFRSAASTR